MTSISAYATKDGRKLWRVAYPKTDGTWTTRRGFPRKVDAQRWAAQNTVDRFNGEPDPDAGDVTLGSLYAPYRASKAVRCKPSYLRTLDATWRTWVAPRWASVRLKAITRETLQQWVGELAAKRSPSVVSRALGIVSGILAQAVEDRRIRSNPATGVTLPRRTQRRHPYLTMGQLKALAGAAGPKRGIILVLGLTGIRWGELCALTVSDVDASRRRLGIRRSVTWVHGEPAYTAPKTWETRTVAYPSCLDTVFRDASDGKRDSDLLFPAPDGRPMRNAKPGRRDSWYAVAKRRAGLPDALTVHDLRHTAASLMVASGASVKAVQRQLGHASASMTLDTYADLFDTDLDDVADRLGVMFDRA